MTNYKIIKNMKSNYYIIREKGSSIELLPISDSEYTRLVNGGKMDYGEGSMLVEDKDGLPLNDFLKIVISSLSK